MIGDAITACEGGPGVAEVEQIVSTGAAVQNMLLAAYALGVGAFWRTGAMAYHPTIAKGLGLTDNEKIIGYLDRKSTRLNSSHVAISYAVFCLKKKKKKNKEDNDSIDTL